MASYIHSVLLTNQTISADGEEIIDLPVNPLSVILINIAPLNNTAAIANYTSLAGLLAALTNIRVEWRGQSIVDISGIDLAAYLMWVYGIDLIGSNVVETDNDRRSIVLPIIFGRKAFSVDECLPSVQRGELQLHLTWDIANTGYDGVTRSIETIELPGSSPAIYQRITTLSQTVAATGYNDVELPIGNTLRGVLAFGTTAFAGASPAPTLGRMSLMKDNVEIRVSSSDFETIRAIPGLTGKHVFTLLDHFHSVNAAGAAQEDTQAQQISQSLYENYALIDLDPTNDDSFVLDTAGAGRVNLRFNAETADSVRVFPIERVDNASFFS